MKAMLLAAGRGKRLGPLTEQTPKPMLNVGGKPLIVHQLQKLTSVGIREIVINLFHLGTQIEEFLGDGGEYGVDITYSHEHELLDTGGGIVHALKHLGEAPFLLHNADIWTDYSFGNVQVGLPDSDLGRLLLHSTPAHRSDGDFFLKNGYLKRVQENNSPKQRKPYVYCGIAILSPRLFQVPHIQHLLQPNLKPFSLTADLIFHLLDQRIISGEVFEGEWVDIGSPDQLRAIQSIHGA